jgi:hypothetical protein
MGGSGVGGAAGGMGGAGGGPLLPWTKHFGSADDDYAYGVTASGVGDTIIQATIKKPVDFGGGMLIPSGNGHNVALAKYDASGKHVWSKVFTHSIDADPRLLLNDGLGNLFMVGSMEGNFANQDFGGPALPQACDTNTYAVKLDGTGNHVWSKIYKQCSFNSVSDATVDPNHNLLVVGQTMGSVDFGTGPITSNGSDDVVVAKIDNNGGGVWAKNFGDVKSQGSWGIASDSLGSVVIVGTNQGTIDFGGGPISAVGVVGGWAAKLDPNGAHVWSRGFNNVQPTPNGVGAFAVTADSQGNTIVAGTFQGVCDFGGGTLTAVAGGTDLFVAKYDPAGTHMWSKHFGTGQAGPAGMHALEVRAGDEILLAGTFDTAIDLGCGMLQGPQQSALVARFSPNGSCVWSQAIAGSTANLGIKVDATGNAVVYGSFSLNIKLGSVFGNTQYLGVSNYADLFLGKFKP